MCFVVVVVVVVLSCLVFVYICIQFIDIFIYLYAFVCICVYFYTCLLRRLSHPLGGDVSQAQGLSNKYRSLCYELWKYTNTHTHTHYFESDSMIDSCYSEINMCMSCTCFMLTSISTGTHMSIVSDLANLDLLGNTDPHKLVCCYPYPLPSPALG